MLETLGRFPLFKDLSHEDLQILAPIFHARTYSAGAVVIEQGEKAVCLYLLTQGDVIIRYKPYDGETITLDRLHDGGVFGWSAVLGNPLYNSSVVCNVPSETLVVTGKNLHALEAQHPKTARIVMDRLASAVSTRWKNAQTQARSMLEKGISENVSPLGKGTPAMCPAVKSAKEEQLKALLEQLSAYIEQFHGGSVEFVEFDGEVLKVRMGGSCLGCPLSPSTLHGWVEGTVRQFFPEITSVEAV
ncbi:MAG: NifU family protein [Anaerolineales bacterium]